jgi:hypothetical protein
MKNFQGIRISAAPAVQPRLRLTLFDSIHKGNHNPTRVDRQPGPISKFPALPGNCLF